MARTQTDMFAARERRERSRMLARTKPKGFQRGRVSRSWKSTLVLFFFVLLLAIFFLLPLFYAVITSLKPLNEIFIFPPRFFVVNPTFDNFRAMAKVAMDSWVPLERYLFNSFLVSIFGTVLTIAVAALAAYPLAKHKSRAMMIYYQIVVWAILFRPEVTMVPQYLMVSNLGLLDTYWAQILPVVASSFGVFLLRQNILTVPDEMLEAARIDGATEVQVFGSIVLPLLKPALLTLTIFSFRDLWNAPGQNFIYEEAMKPLPTMLGQISAAGIGRAGVGAAVAVLLMIPPILVFLISQSSVMETMSNTGLKG